jgi:long-chain fatty acid transport protein
MVLLTNCLPVRNKTVRGELMKRSIKIAVAAAIALSATSAFATNGDHLIGMGAKSRGMGGIGIGMSHGAESALSNPSLITSVKGTEISFGGTVFMPDVKTTFGVNADSDADLSVIPEVAIAQKANDNFYWGIGMFGVAGMGTDYRGTGKNMDMVTNLQLMQFAVPLAYKSNGVSVGIAPVLQYGSLDINYDATAFGSPGSDTQGVAQDFGFGYNLGLSYETQGLTIGASYKSAIDMEYKGQINAATAQFDAAFAAASGNTIHAAVLSDHLEQPAEIGVGASYKMGAHTFAVDYKKIKWSDAKGYREFHWEDQNVYMIGYQFAQDNWALRAGYNHGSNPIKEQNGATPQGSLDNFFNLIGFPAIVTNHYTAGGTYAFSKMTSLDLAYTYAPEVSDTYSTAAFAGFGAFPTSVTTKHSQQGVTAQLNFNF